MCGLVYLGLRSSCLVGLDQPVISSRIGSIALFGL
jgi:hypothetical protein